MLMPTKAAIYGRDDHGISHDPFTAASYHARIKLKTQLAREHISSSKFRLDESEPTDKTMMNEI
jgi:hypothetical protein